MEAQAQSVSADAPPVNPPPSPPRTVDHSLDVLCHILALALLTGIPFANVLAPLIFWLLKRDEYPSVNEHGKESLNFQISMSLWTILAGLSMLIVIGFLLLPILIIMNVVLVIIASMKASNGELYRYPLTIRFFK
jgi:uncharacterized Tic20 family protein